MKTGLYLYYKSATNFETLQITTKISTNFGTLQIAAKNKYKFGSAVNSYKNKYKKVAESKVIEPELSYKIVNLAYKVFKELGFGYQEKYYQRAYELELSKDGIRYEKENLANLKYAGQNIGNYRLDFLIESKIIVEIKVGERIHQRDFNQVKAYLKKTDLKLGIIILFSPKGVEFGRVLQPSHYKNL